MARVKKATSGATKLKQSIKVVDADIMKNDIISQFDKLKPKDQIDVLRRIGVGVSELYPKQRFATCARCGVVKRVDDDKGFYNSTETGVASHITPICKDCAKILASPRDDNGNRITPSKLDIINTLDWLRKPFIESLYQTLSIAPEQSQLGVFEKYIMNISKSEYIGMNFRTNSDFYNANKITISDDKDNQPVEISIEASEQFEKNKDDCLKLIGYLPYESEDIADQPYLYADLVGFLGSIENASENYLRVRTMIGIVRWFLQLEKIDNSIARLSSSTSSMDANMAAIKGFQDTKSKITDTITKMADDSRISLKSNHDNIKGSNTFTGKLSKLKDLNLRASYVNGFDLETCKAMQQVADISNASILKQLNLDESEWSDMVGEQRKMITKLTNQAHSYQEAARILLKENQDLRQTLTDNGLLNKDDLVDLTDIVNTYWVEGDKHERDTKSGDLQ